MISLLFFYLFFSSCILCLEHEERAELPSNSMLRIGIKYRPDISQCNRKTMSGDLISIHYDAELYKNGKEFDSSRKREEILKFTLGDKIIIPGLEKGLLGMCIGEKRKIVIPSDLAYGNVGAGFDVPPLATLVYDVELMDIE